MITAQEKMSINAYINRTCSEYLSFMEIDSLPEMTRIPFEFVERSDQNLASWAQVFYDSGADKYTLKVLKNLCFSSMYGDHLMFHEYTHVYDIERFAKRDNKNYVSIKGYMEYHAAQVELMKQIGAKKYSAPICFSMTDMVKEPGEEKSVYEIILAKKKDATHAINQPGFPENIEMFAMTMGIIFNHLGRVSVCKRYARDYGAYKGKLENYSIEEQFFGTEAWKLITSIYHDEMSQDAIDLAMMFHYGIMKNAAEKYGVHL